MATGQQLSDMRVLSGMDCVVTCKSEGGDEIRFRGTPIEYEEARRPTVGEQILAEKLTFGGVVIMCTYRVSWWVRVWNWLRSFPVPRRRGWDVSK
jgi:hypothetical protein